eukprot:g4338.t1
MKCRGKKNTSKRKSLSTQHKITKKAAEKKRKLRKEARKAIKAGVQIKRKKEKIAVPGLWPFKEQELQFLKERQEGREAEREKHKELNQQKRKELQSKKRKEALKAPARPVHGLESTLQNADLVIEVVDARDPFATRCVSLEKDGSKRNKIMVVTKGDLVPKENLEKWLAYLRDTVPQMPVVCVMKKASAGETKKIVRDVGAKASSTSSSSAASRLNSLKASRPVGFKQLAAVLSQGYSASRNIAVVGYPGTGKHTVVAYLKSPQMNLNKKVKISAANIMEEAELDGNTTDDAVMGVDLLFTRKPQAAKNPLLVLKRLLERCVTKKELQLKLMLPEFDDAKSLLEKIQRDNNLPGVLDAARWILKRLSGMFYYTQVPAPAAQSQQSSETASNVEAEAHQKNIVQDNLKRIYADNATEINAVKNWGQTTPTTGLVDEVAQAMETASKLEGPSAGAVDLRKRASMIIYGNENTTKSEIKLISPASTFTRLGDDHDYASNSITEQENERGLSDALVHHAIADVLVESFFANKADAPPPNEGRAAIHKGQEEEPFTIAQAISFVLRLGEPSEILEAEKGEVVGAVKEDEDDGRVEQQGSITASTTDEEKPCSFTVEQWQHLLPGAGFVFAGSTSRPPSSTTHARGADPPAQAAEPDLEESAPAAPGVAPDSSTPRAATKTVAEHHRALAVEASAKWLRDRRVEKAAKKEARHYQAKRFFSAAVSYVGSRAGTNTKPKAGRWQTAPSKSGGDLQGMMTTAVVPGM